MHQAAHSADPRQLGTEPAGGTPPEELADAAALVSVQDPQRVGAPRSGLLPTKIVIGQTIKITRMIQCLRRAPTMRSGRGQAVCGITEECSCRCGDVGGVHDGSEGRTPT